MRVQYYANSFIECHWSRQQPERASRDLHQMGLVCKLLGFKAYVDVTLRLPGIHIAFRNMNLALHGVPIPRVVALRLHATGGASETSHGAETLREFLAAGCRAKRICRVHGTALLHSTLEPTDKGSRLNVVFPSRRVCVK